MNSSPMYITCSVFTCAVLVFSPRAYCQVKIPGQSDLERLQFLIDLDDHDPLRQKYYEAALGDASVEVRSEGAYMLGGDISRAIPLLLKTMTTDSSSRVRASAALNFNCRLTCNGTDFEAKHIKLLEDDLETLKVAIRGGDTGREVLDAIYDDLWCEFSDEARADIRPVLKSKLPHGNSSVSIDELAKGILEKESVEPCQGSSE